MTANWKSGKCSECGRDTGCSKCHKPAESGLGCFVVLLFGAMMLLFVGVIQWMADSIHLGQPAPAKQSIPFFASPIPVDKRDEPMPKPLKALVLDQVGS